MPNRLHCSSCVRLGLILAIGFLSVRPVSATEPLPVDSILSMRDFPLTAAVSVSYDGTWAAYTLQPTGAEGTAQQSDHYEYFLTTGAPSFVSRSEVWVANTLTHEQFQISPKDSSSWDPAFSPDGRSLAFYSDADGTARVWLWVLASRRSHRLSDVSVHPAGFDDLPVWSPDGRSLFVKTQSPNKSRPALAPPTQSDTAPRVLDSNTADALSAGTTSTPRALPGLGRWEIARSDISRIAVDSGRAEPLVHDKPLGGIWISPSGRELAVTYVDGFAADNVYFPWWTLSIVDLATRTARRCEHHLLLSYLGRSVSWSPDSKHLAYAASQEPHEHAFVDLFTMSADVSAAPVRLSHTVHPHDAAQMFLYQPPLWAEDGVTVLWPSPDAIYAYQLDGTERALELRTDIAIISVVVCREHSLLRSGAPIYIWARNNRTLDLELHSLDLSSGVDTLLTTDSICLALYPSRYVDTSADGATAVYLAEASDAPPDLWVMHPGTGHPERLTHANPQMDTHAFAQSRVLFWKRRDGSELRGTMLLPPDCTTLRPCPLVVQVYGGVDLSLNKNTFGTSGLGVLNGQLLATRGYALLLPNTPMGTDSPIRDLLEDVLPGIDKAVELGSILGDQVAVMGASYGGYSTLALVAQSDRFKAAIAIAPVVDLVDMFTWMDEDGSSPWINWAEKDQGRMAGNPWQIRDKYIANSPLFIADRIHAPVMIVTGGTDAMIVHQARRMFVALRSLGRIGEYIEYPHGGHVPPDWSRPQQRDFAARVFAWLDRYVRNHSQRPQRE